jgi:hypothetical protein
LHGKFFEFVILISEDPSGPKRLSKKFAQFLDGKVNVPISWFYFTSRPCLTTSRIDWKLRDN